MRPVFSDAGKRDDLQVADRRDLGEQDERLRSDLGEWRKRRITGV
jgi:hypothetical protein